MVPFSVRRARCTAVAENAIAMSALVTLIGGGEHTENGHDGGDEPSPGGEIELSPLHRTNVAEQEPI